MGVINARSILKLVETGLEQAKVFEQATEDDYAEAEEYEAQEEEYQAQVGEYSGSYQVPQRSTKSGEISMLLEDREHDWLAMQLKEEQRILMRGDLMDLGASHNASCDARDIKEEHHKLHLKGRQG